MNIGDLLNEVPRASALAICLSVDYSGGTYTVREITDQGGNIFDDSTPPQFGVYSLSSQKWVQIAWGGFFCNNIMNKRPFPTWVHTVVASANQKSGPGQPNQVPGVSYTPTVTASQQGAVAAQQTYPIGTLVMGTNKIGNVWIVNKDNTRDISLLWDGRQGRFCGSELERTDRLVPGPQTVKTIGEVNDHIKSQVKIVPAWPIWARHMTMTQTIPLVASLKPSAGMSPAVANQLVKANIISQPKEEVKKPVDSFRDKCNHSFKTYIGFSHIYEYCEYCDIKRNA